MKIEKNARVAFQGERGAFSEEAGVKLLSEEISLVPRPTFEAAFSAIRDGVADYILAPIENSLAGSVHRSFDLLVDSELNILAEVVIPIVHNLIVVPGAKFEDIVVSNRIRWRSRNAKNFSARIHASRGSRPKTQPAAFAR